MHFSSEFGVAEGGIFHVRASASSSRVKLLFEFGERFVAFEIEFTGQGRVLGLVLV